ncbi:hypothetical protein GCM10027054_14950 [Isoptericola nanjingensis]
MRRTGRQRRPDLGEVDGRRRGRGVGTDREQQGGRGDAVGHAQAAVDKLRTEAHEGKEDESPHGGSLRFGAAAGPPRLQ